MVTDAILDTSVLIDLLRAFPPALDGFASLGRQRISITPVVWMEMVQGRRIERNVLKRSASCASSASSTPRKTNLKHFQPLPSVDVKRPY